MTKDVDCHGEDRQLVKELYDTIKSERVTRLIDVKEGYLYTVKREINTRHISIGEYKHLKGLYNFMLKHPELKDRHIEDLIDMKPLAFWFLNECVCHIRGFIPELRKNGVEEMALEIATRNALRIFSENLQ